MQIWIDADACPVAVRDVAIRAALRLRISIVFVANKQLILPQSEFVKLVTVEAGADMADKFIQENAQGADLVVTQDIPLAHALVSKGIVVINPRGEVYTEHNIGSRISMRDLLQGLRDAGEITGGPKQFGEKEKRAFAASFDRELSKLRNRK
jgi:uncharacterized protein YaiI (UPF0178 family)